MVCSRHQDLMERHVVPVSFEKGGFRIAVNRALFGLLGMPANARKKHNIFTLPCEV